MNEMSRKRKEAKEYHSQCSHIRTECSYQVGHSNLILKVEQSLVINYLLRGIGQRGPQVHVLLKNIQ